jgi:hypothetical protein
MQVPSQTQWWSKLITQLLQMLQWLVRYGLKIMHDSQNLSLYNYGEAEY